MGVEIVQHGNFNNTERYFKSLINRDYIKILDVYGQKGVDALRAATPIDTGLAASSWGYHIEQDKNNTILVWTNDDIEGGCNVAILVDRGHATKSGSWSPGLHFIDQAIAPIIAELAREVLAYDNSH